MTDARPTTKLNEVEQPETGEAMALIDQTAALFAYKHPQLVGAALTDLMATWLSGHLVVDENGKEDAPATRRMREQVIKIQMRAVWQMVELRDLERQASQGKPQ
jgi:hypothetical protein